MRSVQAQVRKMCKDDAFKECFSYYKKKKPPPNLEKVLDFDSDSKPDCIVPISDESRSNLSPCNDCDNLGLRPHSSWEMYTLKFLEGFLLIRNPFTIAGQQSWIRKSLESYPSKPSVTNLDRFFPDADDIWSQRNDADPEKRKYIEKLCWATLGYNYNWDTKKYDKNVFSRFPNCLKNLSEHIAHILGFHTFKTEAAIVNYYNLKSRLSIHKDESEEALDMPLISCSFGQTGLFLMGTESRDDPPTPMFLRSGDIVIMSGACRKSYHAVPQIFLENNVEERYGTSDEDDWLSVREYIDKSRVNVSMRQVFQTNSNS